MSNLLVVNPLILKLHNSLLDGEHVAHDKMGKFINLFLVFDIYFKHG